MSLHREGLVFRALEEARELGFGPISFKCISNEWLLKYDSMSAIAYAMPCTSG